MKKNLLASYCFFIVFIISFNLSQAKAQGWVRFLLPDTLYQPITEIIPHPDGGVLVAYTTYYDPFIPLPVHENFAKLVHFNTNGDLVWQKTIMPRSIARDLAIEANGLPAVLVYDNTTFQLRLFRFDWQGNELGANFIGKSSNPIIEMAAFPGGGFVSNFTYRDDPILPPTKAALHRFDSNDSLLWRSDIDEQTTSSWLLDSRGIAVNSQGQTLVACWTGWITHDKHQIVMVDAQGDSIWQRQISDPITAGVLADDNFFYVDHNPPLIDATVIRKISPNGDIIWEKPGDPYTVHAIRGKYFARPDGGFVLCGIGPGVSILIQVFDSQGNVLHRINRKVPGYGDMQAEVSAFTQTPNGDFYVCGLLSDGLNSASGSGFILKMDSLGNVYPQRIWGVIADDYNQNCIIDAGEHRQEGHKIQIEDLASGRVYYASSDTAGRYSVENDSLQFLVSHLSPNPYWESCYGDTLIDFSNGVDSIQVDFPLSKVVECPFLEVDIAAAGLRRCFDNYYYVRYCNSGTATAENVYVDVTLDPYQTYLSSSTPAIDMGNGRWRFPLEDIDYGRCGFFAILVHLDCDSTVLGQTHCVEAHIYPDSFCLQNSAWSGANVEVSAQCNPDSVELVIKNTGTAANVGLLDYVIIEDNIMFFQGHFQLPAGDSIIIRVPSNGATWRLEAEQEPFSPGDPMPSATVEGCGLDSTGNISIGFVSQFGENDGNPYLSVDCRENGGSYDPNDKQAFPKGVGEEHWIEAGSELEYQIRFQNTGTDTAFTVEVLDTLAEWLDPASIRTGASSHPYSFDLSGRGTLRFHFANILLPDSTKNEAASHGFVKFFVRIRPDVPLNTFILNSAAIYFDFNDPVITNTVTHKIGKDFLPTISATTAADRPLAEMSIFPNPARNESWVKFAGYSARQGFLEIQNAQGRVVVQQVFVGDQVLIKAGNLPAGLYLIRAFDGDKWLGNGKIIWL